MKLFPRFLRFFKINYIFLRYNIAEIVFSPPFTFPLRFLHGINPIFWRPRVKLTRGERIRLALTALGPIFIKAGQILSTRRDLLPEDIALELLKLQDQVPPFCGQKARKIIEKALGKPISEVFHTFEEKALASASIAQVHAATLLDGQSVVIKVLRPHIQKTIERDIDLLNFIASLLMRFWRTSRRFKLNEIVNEIAMTLRDELDLMREGANAAQLKRNFNDSPQLYIPKIYWSYSRPTMLVMERIQGIPIHQIARLKQLGYNMQKLAELGIEIFFTQVFRDSFFHADMHPGNIFVSENKDNPQFIAVDFGIVGSLNTLDQRYLAENLLAFFKRDYQRVAELHLASGWLPKETRIDQFEGAIRAVCEPIFAKPLKEISFGQLLMRLFQTAHRFQINIQPQLILLQKTLLNIEGLGRELYPDLDLWKTATPFLEKWLKRQVGLKAFFSRVRENMPFWSEKLPEIPNLLFEFLQEKRNKEAEHSLKKSENLSMQNVSERLPWRFFLYGMGIAFAISALIYLCIR